MYSNIIHILLFKKIKNINRLFLVKVHTVYHNMETFQCCMYFLSAILNKV